MFITLLAVTFVIAVLVTSIVAWVFRTSIRGILVRIFIPEIAAAWQRFMAFAIYVVGISGGVRIWDLEKYITPKKDEPAVILNTDRWVLEVYRTIIETLQATAWLLLAFFLIAIVAYGISRAAGKGSPQPSSTGEAPPEGTAG